MFESEISESSGDLTFDRVPSSVNSLINSTDFSPSTHIIRSLELGIKNLSGNIGPSKIREESDSINNSFKTHSSIHTDPTLSIT